MLAITGEDPLVEYRGKYNDELSAYRILKEEGGVVGLATRLLGQEVPRLMAQVGDVCLIVNQDGRDTLAVFTGDCLVAPGKDGLERVPLERAMKVWRCTTEG